MEINIRQMRKCEDIYSFALRIAEEISSLDLSRPSVEGLQQLHRILEQDPCS